MDWARQAVLALLAAGKDVVTANKALLAQHGAEVFDAARRHGRAVAFEASVAGGVPIIAALAQSLAANQILAIQGILNGTSNFILTSMTEDGRSYADALAEAQRRGYAEADPTLDVDGTDAAHKLAILAQIAFGVAVPMSAIECRGIAEVDALDIRFAGELGYTIKLLAEAYLIGRPAGAARLAGAAAAGDAAGPGARRLQRHLRGRRRRGRHAVLRTGGGADADGQRRDGRPDRPGRRPQPADVPDACGCGTPNGDADAAAAAGDGAHAVLPAAAGGRPAGRAGGGGARAGASIRSASRR